MLKKTKTYIIGTGFFVLSFFFYASPILAAGLVPCGGQDEEICTLCHLIIGINWIISWIRNISAIVALAGITIAGAMYVVSAGTELKNQAKKFITATLTGFAVIFAAWLIVNITIWLLAVKTDLGTGIETVNWHTFSCSKTTSNVGSENPNSITVTPTGNTTCATTGNGCGGINVTSSVSSAHGCDFTSPELVAALTCLKNKGVGATVTSVALNDHSDWCEKCVNAYSGKSYCSHSQYSCHFGGRSCPGTSQAVDLSPSESVAQAAAACGFDTVWYKDKEWVHNGPGVSGHDNHIHASVNNSTCGCR